MGYNNYYNQLNQGEIPQTMSPDALLKWNLIIVRSELLDTMRYHEEKYGKGKLVGPEKVRSYINRLYREIKQGYAKHDEKEAAKIQSQINNAETLEQLQEAFDKIDSYLYNKGFIRPREFSDPLDPRNTE